MAEGVGGERGGRKENRGKKGEEKGEKRGKESGGREKQVAKVMQLMIVV